MESKPDENNVKHNIFLLYSDKVSFFLGFNFGEANALITLNYNSKMYNTVVCKKV